MDSNDIMDFIDKLPKKLRNNVYSSIISTMLASSKVEKEILSSNPETSYDGDEMEIQNIQNQLLADLKGGIRNEQYVQYFYQVLKKADEFMENSDVRLLNEAAEKWGMNVNQKDKLQFNNSYSGNKINTGYELIKENKEHLKNPFNPHSEKHYEIKATSNDNERVDSYIQNIRVTRIDENNKTIELGLNRNYRMGDTKTFDKLKSIKSVFFADRYGEPFYFAINEFKTTKIKGTQTVLIFNAVKLDNIL